MLSIIIIWLYVFLICLVYGYGGAVLLRVLLKGDGFGRLPFSMMVIFGLCLITTIVGYLSLFIKIGFAANLIILLGASLIVSTGYEGIVATVKHSFQRLCNLNKLAIILLLISFLFVWVKSTDTPSSFDTGLYHAQAIRWIEEYPAIPGLGNLHGRLAFNSAWFLPNALFGFSFLKLQRFHVLNGFFLLVIVFMSMQGLSNLLQKQYSFSNILQTGISIPATLVFKGQLSSPTPDIPVALLICALFIYYFQVKESNDEVAPVLVCVIIGLLSVFAVTVKLSALPLVLFVALVVNGAVFKGRPVNLLIIPGLMLVIVLPFFLRNLVLSGYLVYPFPGLDWFNFDWKIPAAKVLAEKQAIEVFSRDPRGVAGPELAKGMYYWLPLWFHQLITDNGRKLEKVFLPSLVLLVDYLYSGIAFKKFQLHWHEISGNRLPYLIAFGGLLFWFLAAPDLRFVMGFLMIIAIIVFIPLLQTFNYQVSRIFPWATGLLLCYFLMVFLAKDIPFLGQRLWLPANYPQVPLASEEIQGRKVYYPQGGKQQCWDAPLPCICSPAVKFAFRGEKIEDGFKPR